MSSRGTTQAKHVGEGFRKEDQAVLILNTMNLESWMYSRQRSLAGWGTVSCGSRRSLMALRVRGEGKRWAKKKAGTAF